MYASIYELPSEVLNSLDEQDAGVWLTNYNKLDPKTPDEVESAKKSAWRSCRELPSSFSFKIIASADAVDVDKEIIDVPSVKANMDAFIKAGGNLNFNHGNYRVGVIYDWEPTTVKGADAIAVYGNLFGNNLVAKTARDKFIHGTNSLSIAGEAEKGRYMCDDKGCYTRRQVAPNGLMEISITSNPANKACTLIDYHEGKSIAKSAHESNIIEYEIHKTYDECPILKLKKSLMDCGIEAHAREDGVFVPMGNSAFIKTLPKMKAAGLVVEKIEGGAMVNDKDFILEKSFKKAYDEGLIDESGVFLKGYDSDTFRKAMDKGLICRMDGEFRYVEPQFNPEHIIKMAGWKKQGEAGKQAVQEMKQSDNPLKPEEDENIPYEFISSGILHKNWEDKFDPSKFTPIRNFRSAQSDIETLIDEEEDGGRRDDPNNYFFVNQLGLPLGGLYASSRNSRGSSHWLDAWRHINYKGHEKEFDPEKANGFSFDLNKDANIIRINGKDDYNNLLKQYPNIFRGGSTRGVNWEDAASKGVDGVYFSPQFVDWFRLSKQDDPKYYYGEGERWNNSRREKRFKGVANLNLEGPDHLIILNPRAIGRQKPFYYKNAKPDEWDRRYL